MTEEVTWPSGDFSGVLTEGIYIFSVSGQFNYPTAGVLTFSSCTVTGYGTCKDPSYEGFLDAGLTVVVGTEGADSHLGSTDPDAKLSVYVKEASSPTTYSPADLVGTWRGNCIAAGPGAPYWERHTVTVETGGTFADSVTTSGGSTVATTGNSSFSSTTTGAVVSTITSASPNVTLTGFMDAGKTVLVYRCPWGDGTYEIMIFTKDAAIAPGAPTNVVAGAGTITQEAAVHFRPPASNGGPAATSYTVTSAPEERQPQAREAR